MKNFYFRFAIIVLTFVIGLVSVWFFQYKNLLLKPKEEAISYHEVAKETEPVKLILDDSNNRQIPRFIPTARGCGMGYVQSYETNDGYSLREGVFPISRIKFNKNIKKAVRIIERVKNAKNRDGEKGLRVILESCNEDDGKQFYEIIWYGNGFHNFIEAPTLELALEFEKSNAYAY